MFWLRRFWVGNVYLLGELSMIFFSYLKMFLISLATGFGLGFGFWSAHLFMKWVNKKLDGKPRGDDA